MKNNHECRRIICLKAIAEHVNNYKIFKHFYKLRKCIKFDRGMKRSFTILDKTVPVNELKTKSF